MAQAASARSPTVAGIPTSVASWRTRFSGYSKVKVSVECAVCQRGKAMANVPRPSPVSQAATAGRENIGHRSTLELWSFSTVSTVASLAPMRSRAR